MHTSRGVRRFVAGCVALVLVASGVSVVVGDRPTVAAAADNGQTFNNFLDGSSKAFGAAAKIFESLEPAAPYVDMVSSLAMPFISLFWKPDPGPSIQDVLDKLDQLNQQLTKQLEQIRDQLAAVQSQLTQLGSDVHLGSCSSLINTLNPSLVLVRGAQSDYETLIDEEAGIATAGNPTLAVTTMNHSFGDFATTVLGSGTSVASSPIGQAIQLIHTDLVQPAAGLGQGIIAACAQVALEQWRAHPTASGWLSDDGYYTQITDLVRSYEDYEVQGTTFIEEAAYYRAAELLHQDDPTVSLSPDDRYRVCAIALHQAAEGSAARLCKNVSAFVTATYDDIVNEWATTGRPYADGDPNVTLVPGSNATGVGSQPPELWVTDPTKAPTALVQGHWSTTTLPATPYAGISGWEPASLADWNALEANHVWVSPASANLVVAMQGTKVFNNLGDLAPFWIPGQTIDVGFQNRTVDINGTDTTFHYTGPKLFLRCGVYNASIDTQAGGIACSDAWWQAAARVLVTGDANRNYQASYSAPGFIAKSSTQNFGGTPPSTVDFDLVDSTLHGGITYCGTGSTCTGTTYVRRIMPVAPVPTGPDCTNTIGLPKLCTAGPNDAAFKQWVADNIPNPDAPAPEPGAAPTMTQAAHATSCASGAWTTNPSPTYGSVVALPTTWTGQWSVPGTGGATVRTVEVPTGQPLDDTTFATGGGFPATAPFTLICTVSGRWTNLVNTGSAQSTVYQVTPHGANGVLTRRPAAPAVGTATVQPDGNVKVTWTVGDDDGSAITAFTITPYVGGVAGTPLVVPADNGDRKPAPGSNDSWSVPAAPGTTVRYDVSDNTVASSTSTVVVGVPSALTAPLTVPVAPPPTTTAAPTTTTTATTATTTAPPPTTTTAPPPASRTTSTTVAPSTTTTSTSP